MSHILLIEPDPILADIYRRAFRLAGWQVAHALQGQAAIDSADKHVPDAVVLELQLPGHSGIEFLYEFRSYSEWQRVPVIIHTFVPPAEFSDVLSLRKELAVEDYCYKPSTKITQLIAVVRRRLSVEQ